LLYPKNKKTTLTYIDRIYALKKNKAVRELP